MTQAVDSMVGRKIGKFRIDKKLGEGGMGAVYRATDTSIDREVALKVIRPELAENPDFVARFQREAKVAGKFRHVNAIVLFEYSPEPVDGVLYMAFEFVRGRELRDVIRDLGRIAPARAVRITSQVLAVLEAAAREGIVHRDLKPQNVMLTEEHDHSESVKVLDFGIAKLKQGDAAALTLAGQVMGTVGFMSPEQTEGRDVDVRSDLYSVGVMLFQMLTGQLPFSGRNAIEVMEKHRKARPPTLRSLEPAVPDCFEAVVARAMAKKPEERYQTPREFRQALEALPLPAENESQAPTRAPARKDATTETNAVPPSAKYSSGQTGEFFEHLVGRTLESKYKIERLLGVGGMGAVFKAMHVELGTPVALKVLHPSVVDQPEMQERFLREARAAIQLIHPNAIPVRDFGRTTQGLLYMTQDFSPGHDLKHVVQKEAPLAVARAFKLMRQALQALAEAHRKGIVHRDLKPANMLVEDGDHLRVCDFGIAKILADGEEKDGVKRSQEGELTGQQIIGTPYYMAPEQARSKPVDRRADIYAIGCVLYELLTGQKPFQGDNPLEILMKQISQTPVPPSRLRPELRPEVEAIVLRAMAKDPGERFQTAEELLAAIDGLGLTPREGPTTSRLAEAATLAPRKQEPEEEPALAPRAPGGGKLLPALAFLSLLAAGVLAGVMLAPESRLPVVLQRLRTSLLGGGSAAVASNQQLAGGTRTVPIEPSKPQEPAKPESIKPEPTKPEPTKPEPTKPEPTKPEPEPIKPLPEPIKPEPTKPEPTKPEPIKPDPTKPEPTKPEPIKPEPTKPDPIKPDPTKPEPTKPEPIKPDPTKPDPIKPEPTKPEPTKPEPIKPDPIKPEPTKPEPIKPEPIKPEPEPIRPLPEPTKPEPIKPLPEPTKPEPTKPEPIKPLPEPTKPEPIKPLPEPTKPEPTKPEPAPVAEPWPRAEPVEPRPTQPGPTDPPPSQPPPTEIPRRPVDTTPGTGRGSEGENPPSTPSGEPRPVQPGDTGRRAVPETPQAGSARVRVEEWSPREIPVLMAQVADKGTWLSARELTLQQFLRVVEGTGRELNRPRVLEVVRATLGVPAQQARGRRRGMLAGLEAWLEDNHRAALARPVKGVPLELSRELAEWLGMRLPTEAEWLAAASVSGTGRQDAPVAGQAGIEGLKTDWEWLSNGRLAGFDDAGRPAVRQPTPELRQRAGLRLAHD